MEQHKRMISPQILIPELLAVLEEAENVPLLISGGSMTPFLADGRDTVYLSRVNGPLKKGDMILYRRDTGRYVLHRICGEDSRGFRLVGDAQTKIEQGIRQDQVLAVVTSVQRKGKILKKGSFWWDFFEKVWIRMVPLRPLVMAVYRLLTGKHRQTTE